jgi:hypothetical protein
MSREFLRRSGLLLGQAMRFTCVCSFVALASCSCSQVPKERPTATVSPWAPELTIFSKPPASSLGPCLGRYMYVNAVLLAHASMLGAQGDQAMLAAPAKSAESEEDLCLELMAKDADWNNCYSVALCRHLDQQSLQYLPDEPIDFSDVPVAAVISCFWMASKPPTEKDCPSVGETQSVMAFYLCPLRPGGVSTVELVLRGKYAPHDQTCPQIEVVSARAMPDDEMMELRSQATKIGHKSKFERPSHTTTNIDDTPTRTGEE